MMNFFREQKLITALMVGSLLVLLVGVGLIVYSNKAAKEAEQAAATVQRLTTIANSASEQLQQTVVYSDVPIADVKPEDSLAKVSAMNGRVPEVGSADWCEVMMVKDAAEWTKDEQSLFAKNCI
jgi:predicted negative regulator of RcsB-dependent stress response